MKNLLYFMQVKTWNLFLILSVVSVLIVYEKIICAEPLSPRTVRTKYGFVRGVLRHYNKLSVPQLPSSLPNLPDKFSVEIFRSLPFAQLPILNLRFLPPVTQSRWRGTKLANRFAPVCIQNTAEVVSNQALKYDEMSSLLTSQIKTKNSNQQPEDFNSKQPTKILLNNLQNLDSKITAFLSKHKKIAKDNLNQFSSNTEYKKNYASSSQLNNFLIKNLTKSDLKQQDNFSSASDILNRLKEEKFLNLLHKYQAKSNNFFRNSFKINYKYFQPFENFIKIQNEDCLYLNIYAPFEGNLKQKTKFPVLVFVNGESYDWGTGNAYDGSMIAGLNQIIVVTLNYRLGVFGFMPSLIEGTLRFNHGILDVVASLHWIQDNISQFGGLHENVTLCGHNRGAALVQFLMQSSLSKGLFHRAILLSGSSISSWATAVNIEQATRKLALYFNCSNSEDLIDKNENLSLFDQAFLWKKNWKSSSLSSSDFQMFQCLRSQTSEKLRTAAAHLTQKEYSPFNSLFAPTFDQLLIKEFNSNFWSKPSQNLKLNSNQNDSTYNQINLNLKRNSIKKFWPLNLDENLQHDLLIGFDLNSPIFKSNLKNLFKQLDLTSLETYVFLNEIVNYVNKFLKAHSFAHQNNLNNFFDLTRKQTFSMSNNHSSSSYKNQLIHVVNSILLDLTVIDPMFYILNKYVDKTRSDNFSDPNQHYFKAFAFFLPSAESEDSNDEHNDQLEDEDLSLLFGSSIAGFYYNVSTRLGRFNTKHSLKQVQKSQQMMSILSNFVQTGDPNLQQSAKESNWTKSYLSNWPMYDTTNREYVWFGKQWKLHNSKQNRHLQYLFKLVNLLDQDFNANHSLINELKNKLNSEIQLTKNLSLDLSLNNNSLLLNVVNELTLYLQKKVEFLFKQKFEQFLNSNKLSLQQKNNSNQKLNLNSNPNSTSYQNFDLKRNLNSVSSDQQNNSIFQRTVLFGNMLVAPSDNKSNTNSETSTIITIISVGIFMLIINAFFVLLGYKCIENRRKSKYKTRKVSYLNSVNNCSNLITNSNVNLNTNETIKNDLKTLNTCCCPNSNHDLCTCDFFTLKKDVKSEAFNNNENLFFTSNVMIDDHLSTQICELSYAADAYKNIDKNNSNNSHNSNNLNNLNNLNNSLKASNLQVRHQQSSNLSPQKLTLFKFPNDLNLIQCTNQYETLLDKTTSQNELCNCDFYSNTPMLAVLDEIDSSLVNNELSTISFEPIYKYVEHPDFYEQYSNQNAIKTYQLHATKPQPTSVDVFTSNVDSTAEQHIKVQFPETLHLQVLTQTQMNSSP